MIDFLTRKPIKFLADEIINGTTLIMEYEIKHKVEHFCSGEKIEITNKRPTKSKLN